MEEEEQGAGKQSCLSGLHWQWDNLAPPACPVISDAVLAIHFTVYSAHCTFNAGHAAKCTLHT